MTNLNQLYFHPAGPSAFSTLQKPRSAKPVANKKGKPTPGVEKNAFDVIRAWLEKQDDYTLHRPLRKRFARNPYTVTNLMDVWE